MLSRKKRPGKRLTNTEMFAVSGFVLRMEKQKFESYTDAAKWLSQQLELDVAVSTLKDLIKSLPEASKKFEFTHGSTHNSKASSVLKRMADRQEAFAEEVRQRLQAGQAEINDLKVANTELQAEIDKLKVMCAELLDLIKN